MAMAAAVTGVEAMVEVKAAVAAVVAVDRWRLRRAW